MGVVVPLVAQRPTALGRNKASGEEYTLLSCTSLGRRICYILHELKILIYYLEVNGNSFSFSFLYKEDCKENCCWGVGVVLELRSNVLYHRGSLVVEHGIFLSEVPGTPCSIPGQSGVMLWSSSSFLWSFLFYLFLLLIRKREIQKGVGDKQRDKETPAIQPWVRPSTSQELSWHWGNHGTVVCLSFS